MMVVVNNLIHPVEQWTLQGIPLVSMMSIERRHGKDKPVIEKALVDLKSKMFRDFTARREEWALRDDYRYVPPRQYGKVESTVHLLFS